MQVIGNVVRPAALVAVCLFLVGLGTQGATNQDFRGEFKLSTMPLSNRVCRAERELTVRHSDLETTNTASSATYTFRDGMLFTSPDEPGQFLDRVAPFRYRAANVTFIFEVGFDVGTAVHMEALETRVVRLQCERR